MLNRVTLVGRLVADPEVRYAGDGSPVVKVRLAVNRDRKDADGNRVADFFNAVAFGHAAKFLEQYIAKGRLVSIDGQLRANQWTAQDGSKRTSVEIVIETVNAIEHGGEPPDPFDAP